jgi:DnaK suppressor protein
MNVTEERTRYSEEELREFEQIIVAKIAETKTELVRLKDALSKRNDPGTDTTAGNSKLIEDGADTSEKERLSQDAVRLQKFLVQLENALIRIKNGTYGVCIDTGRLIPKERLRLVPHTQHTIEAKLRRN